MVPSSHHALLIPLNKDLETYFPILIMMGLAFGLSLCLIGLSFLRKRKPDVAKDSPYECGFPPFGDARIKFDVRFYLVAILFVIFDLEIAFLFPWAIVLKEIGLFGFFSMMFFLMTLSLGFLYEWRKGALEWE